MVIFKKKTTFDLLEDNKKHIIKTIFFFFFFFFLKKIKVIEGWNNEVDWLKLAEDRGKKNVI